MGCIRLGYQWWNVQSKLQVYTVRRQILQPCVLHGQVVGSIKRVANCDTSQNFEVISSGATPVRRIKMENFRKKHMTYSYVMKKSDTKPPLHRSAWSIHKQKRLRKFDPVTFGRADIAIENNTIKETTQKLFHFKKVSHKDYIFILWFSSNITWVNFSFPFCGVKRERERGI